jgi:hypothetical protein
MFTSVNPTIRALAETILWTSSDDEEIPLYKNYSAEDINEDCLNKLYKEFMGFVSKAEKRITEAVGDNWDSIDEFYDVIQPIENQTEHDFVLTRNQEGAGFWDGDWCPAVSGILNDIARSFGEINAYVADDGKVYLY